MWRSSIFKCKSIFKASFSFNWVTLVGACNALLIKVSSWNSSLRTLRFFFFFFFHPLSRNFHSTFLPIVSGFLNCYTVASLALSPLWLFFTFSGICDLCSHIFLRTRIPEITLSIRTTLYECPNLKCIRPSGGRRSRYATLAAVPPRHCRVSPSRCFKCESNNHVETRHSTRLFSANKINPTRNRLTAFQLLNSFSYFFSPTFFFVLLFCFLYSPRKDASLREQLAASGILFR